MVDLLFIVTPIVGICNCSMFCCTLLGVVLHRGTIGLSAVCDCGIS